MILLVLGDFWHLDDFWAEVWVCCLLVFLVDDLDLMHWWAFSSPFPHQSLSGSFSSTTKVTVLIYLIGPFLRHHLAWGNSTDDVMWSITSHATYSIDLPDLPLAESPISLTRTLKVYYVGGERDMISHGSPISNNCFRCNSQTGIARWQNGTTMEEDAFIFTLSSSFIF